MLLREARGSRSRIGVRFEGGIKNIPVRKRVGKVSNQMLGRLWWQFTEDPVAELLSLYKGDKKDLLWL